jgi:hypothetical protein
VSRFELTPRPHRPAGAKRLHRDRVRRFIARRHIALDYRAKVKRPIHPTSVPVAKTSDFGQTEEPLPEERLLRVLCPSSVNVS